MSFVNVTRVLFSMVVIVMLEGFTAAAQQKKPKEEPKKEMKHEKMGMNKEKKHGGIKAKAMKEKKLEKKEEAQPK